MEFGLAFGLVLILSWVDWLWLGLGLGYLWLPSWNCNRIIDRMVLFPSSITSVMSISFLFCLLSPVFNRSVMWRGITGASWDGVLLFLRFFFVSSLRSLISV